MKRFAALVDALAFMPSPAGKIRLLADFVARAPDPERGWALAALAGGLAFRAVRPAVLRALVLERVDPVLFGWSLDEVGDLAETVALIWPERPGANRPPDLSEVVAALAGTGHPPVPALIEGWLDALDASGRFALLKFITGALRVGVSADLVRVALAEWAGHDVNAIDAVWHGLDPPFIGLFAWLEGRADRPAADKVGFRPLMLANPLRESDLAALDPARFCAEWTWDGLRVQAVAQDGERRLYACDGGDIGAAFPDLLQALTFDAVLDGELLVMRNDIIGSFDDLRQRLGRKTATVRLMRDYPAHVRLYDLLFEGQEDVRSLGFSERRARLEGWYERTRPQRMDLSPIIMFREWNDIRALRDGPPESGVGGVMLKRRDSAYSAGRPEGAWFKWKREALMLDTVLMYAQRGHGPRLSAYSDLTFGAWRGGDLVPVGKADFGRTDEESVRLDRWIRNNTINRYGPVREVAPALVLEVACDGVHRSSRHKSGLVLREPRVSRIRWDKPVAEADTAETLERLVGGTAGGG